MGHVSCRLGILSASESYQQTNLRTKPLTIKINWPDGSYIQVVISADAFTWTELAAYDADGNILPVSPSASGAGYYFDPDGFADREFSFGENAYTSGLLDWLESFPMVNCRAEFEANRVSVICTRD